MTSFVRQRRGYPDLPWDDGVTWFVRRTVEPTSLPLSKHFVADQVLRLADTSAELDYVTSLITAATEAAERDTRRALMPQTLEMVLSGFPASGRIVLERPPLIEVTSVSYYDAAGDVQQLAVSPSDFDTVPSGFVGKAEIRPLEGASWPSTSVRGDAVTVTYEAGYEDTDDMTFSLIKAGIALMVGELYKQRTLSVHAVRNAPSVLDLKRFWRPVF